MNADIHTYIHTYVHTYIRTYIQGRLLKTNPISHMYCNSHEVHTEGVGGAELTVDVVWHVLVAVTVSTSAGALPIRFGSFGEVKPHTWILSILLH